MNQFQYDIPDVSCAGLITFLGLLLHGDCKAEILRPIPNHLTGAETRCWNVDIISTFCMPLVFIQRCAEADLFGLWQFHLTAIASVNILKMNNFIRSALQKQITAIHRLKKCRMDN